MQHSNFVKTIIATSDTLSGATIFNKTMIAVDWAIKDLPAYAKILKAMHTKLSHPMNTSSKNDLIEILQRIDQMYQA